jgi:hypothetical protein
VRVEDPRKPIRDPFRSLCLRPDGSRLALPAGVAPRGAWPGRHWREQSISAECALAGPVGKWALTAVPGSGMVCKSYRCFCARSPDRHRAFLCDFAGNRRVGAGRERVFEGSAERESYKESYHPQKMVTCVSRPIQYGLTRSPHRGIGRTLRGRCLDVRPRGRGPSGLRNCRSRSGSERAAEHVAHRVMHNRPKSVQVGIPTLTVGTNLLA